MRLNTRWVPVPAGFSKNGNSRLSALVTFDVTKAMTDWPRVVKNSTFQLRILSPDTRLAPLTLLGFDTAEDVERRSELWQSVFALVLKQRNDVPEKLLREDKKANALTRFSVKNPGGTLWRSVAHSELATTARRAHCAEFLERAESLTGGGGFSGVEKDVQLASLLDAKRALEDETSPYLRTNATEMDRLRASVALSGLMKLEVRKYPGLTDEERSTVAALRKTYLERLSRRPSNFDDDRDANIGRDLTKEAIKEIETMILADLDSQRGSQVASKTSTRRRAMEYAQFHRVDEKLMKAAAHAKPKEKPLTFDEALTLLSNYPLLQRALGLVLEFELPAGVIQDGTGCLAIRPSLPGDYCIYAHSTQYLCKSSKGLFLPASGQKAIVRDGCLDVSRKDDRGDAHFVLETIDLDGIMQQRLYRDSGSQSGITVGGYEAPRSAGIALVFRGKADHLQGAITGAAERRSQVTKKLAGGTSPGTVFEDQEPLYADDLLRGFRVDILDRKRKKWFSLCRRECQYTIDTGDGEEPLLWPPEGAVESEAGVRFGVTQALTPPGSPTELCAHEILARWENWSLAVARPGTEIPDEMKYRRPGESRPAPASLTKEGKLPIQEVVSRVPKGSLPPQAFGNHYRVRARAEFVTGDGLAFSEDPDEDGSLGGKDAKGKKDFQFLRYEPLASPVVVLFEELDVTDCPARQLNTLVVKGTGDRDRRWVAPPRVAVEFARLHMDLVGFNAAALRDSAFRGIYLEPDGSFPDAAKVRNQSGGTQSNPILLRTPGTNHAPYLPEPLTGHAWLRLTARDLGELAAGPLGKDDLDQMKSIGYYPRGLAEWPKASPFLVVLKPATLPEEDGGLTATLERSHPDATSGYAAEIALLPGEVAYVRLSSGLGNDERIDARGKEEARLLKAMALWSDSDPLCGAGTFLENREPALAEPIRYLALHGQLQQLTPGTEIQLVHPVKKPISVTLEGVSVPAAPKEDSCVSSSRDRFCLWRKPNATDVDTRWTFKLHRPSTGTLDLFARWKEYYDPVDRARPVMGTESGSAQLGAHQRVPLSAKEAGARKGRLNRKEEEIVDRKLPFGDTKHRNVELSATAFTRFREYYPPGTGDLGAEPEFRRELEAPATYSVPSSRRPDPPKIAYVVPVLEWEPPNEIPPLGRTSKRKGGLLRVFVERPWFSSGEGERLAVIVLDKGEAVPPPEADWRKLNSRVTRWGVDPIWKASSVQPLPALPGAMDFPSGASSDSLTLAELEPLKVQAVSFPLVFDEERQTWYADIAIRQYQTYTPFIRFAFSRYQPDSLSGLELSEPVLAEFAQILPDRTASVTYDGLNDHKLSVVISGVGPGGSAEPNSLTNKMNVSVEELCGSPGAATWHRLEDWTHGRPQGPDTVVIEAASDSPRHVCESGVYTWAFSVTLPRSRRDRRYRLVIAEEEILAVDGTAASEGNTERPLGSRTVYFDILGI